MSDTITLRVGNKELQKFTSYSLDADFYLAADAFQVETAGIIDGITAGQRVQVWVNGKKELDGLLDRPSSSVEKGKISFKLAGRDLAGLLVDSHCNGYGDIFNATLKSLTEQLILKVPFIQRNDVVYQFTKDTPAITWETVYVEPCRTIFEVLAEKARACGLVFYALPDGKFYFGQPRRTGDAKFHIVFRKDGRGNNAMSGEAFTDISKRFSEVNVISNMQGTDTKAAADLHTTAKVKDPDFPKDDQGNTIHKPFYSIENTGTQTPAKQAKTIMNMQRRQGFGLTYRVPGHSQNGVNWSINELCSVDDDIQKVKRGNYFIYGRRFGLSKKEGKYTELRLGLLDVA